MNEALHHLRAVYYTRLNGTITPTGGSPVPAYNRVPSNASEPYIKIYSVGTREIDRTQDSFIINCETRIEVVTGFDGDSGGEIQANEIVDGVINAVRTRSSGYPDLSSSSFNVYTTEIENIQYLEDDFQDKSYFRAIIEISNRIEKL
jgi:hypothetical protein